MGVPETSLLRIKSVSVDRLFGRYNHAVELNQDDRVTILHGRNGVGKTVLLRVIDSVFNGHFHEVARIPFESCRIALSDGSTLEIAPIQAEAIETRASEERIAWRVTLSKDGETLHSDVSGYPEDLKRWAMYLERESPHIYRIGPDKWTDSTTEEELSAIQLYDRFGSSLPTASIGSRSRRHKEPAWLTELRSRVQVHFIDTHRLMLMRAPADSRGRRPSTPTPTVREYAIDLQRRIREVLALYATQSQLMDQTFPQRLLQQAWQSASRSKEQLKTQLVELEHRRETLQSLGLLDKGESIPFDTQQVDTIDDEQVTVLNLYVDDTTKKLNVLDDLAKRLQLLIQNVNDKFVHKTLTIDRDGGFVAQDNEGQPLDPERLSSGEQHEIVLLYDLLFKVNPNSLVLIDEPELSLHVLWQKRFLPDLLRIVQTANFDTVLATHSPYIVGARRDLAVALGNHQDNEEIG